MQPFFIPKIEKYCAFFVRIKDTQCIYFQYFVIFGNAVMTWMELFLSIHNNFHYWNIFIGTFEKKKGDEFWPIQNFLPLILREYRLKIS